MGVGREHQSEQAPAVRAAGAVAWIDLGVPAGSAARAGTLALRRVGHAVRADDQVCPIGGGALAVRFGPVASAVPLEVLGDRLARAIGPGVGSGSADDRLTIALGMTEPDPGEPAHVVARRARSAARTSARALAGDGASRRRPAALTVDAASGDPEARRPAAARTLRRRAVRRYATVLIDGAPALAADGAASLTPPVEGTPRPCRLCVVVVDPMADRAESPGFATRTAASVAERLGCLVSVAAVSPDEPLDTSVDGTDVDLVVLVLDGAWVGRSPSWATGAWGLPARLTTAYADKGIPVLAVGAGAGAGAVAACVANGALALFSLDRLADALHSLDELPLDEARQVAELSFPHRFRSLLGLTAGERRILFYLTEGWAAQDIADELVVSLTTVRSHIRSVLRKLEVRSQLAAVAIANSRDLDQHRVAANA